MKFLSAIMAVAAIIPGAVTAPSDPALIHDSPAHNALIKRQGFPWQWWTEGRGQFSCQQQGGGKYSCTWNGQAGGGMVAGTGWTAGRKTVKYTGTYNPKGPGYLSLYGWTRNPLIEYYVIESWDILAPGEKWTWRSNYTSDGHEYQFFTAQRVNKPSIAGTATFTQYFGVRSSDHLAPYNVGAVSGTLNTATHFDAWNKAGYRLGGFERAMYFVTEAFANGTKLPSGTSTITVS